MRTRHSGPVMVVDDDYDLRNSLREILADEGYGVVTAVNGADALGQLRSGARPGVILLDLMMPVMDGSAFCEEWREDPTLSAIPVIVISADSEGRQKATACGATAFARKPLDLPELLGAIDRYVLP